MPRDDTTTAELLQIHGNPPPQKPVVVGIADFLARDFPPRENILTPWLPSQGLAMIYAPRGVGKTHVSLGIGYAVASGGTFLRWKAGRPRGVLFLDGEMPAPVLQERLANIAITADEEPQAPLSILTPDLQGDIPMPDLSTPYGREAIDAVLTDDIALLIVDNISTLARTGKENEADSWLPVQEWALKQRSQGRSVLFIHHAGKGGQQRGTSRREDVLDSVVSLKRPPDYNPVDGAVFEVHFEKARGCYGDDVSPFEAKLIPDAHDRLVWSTRSVEESTLDKVAKLANDGLKARDIQTELNLPTSTVYYNLKRAKEFGLIQGGQSQ